MNKSCFYILTVGTFTLSFFCSTQGLDRATRALLESERGQLFMAHCGYKLLKTKGPETAARSFALVFNTQNTEQLVQFFRQIQNASELFSPSAAHQSQTYAQFLSTLEKYKTSLGTTLADWALRFLTVDALLLAQADPTVSPDNLARVLTDQFIDALLALQRRFLFSVPADLDKIIFEKERLFLERSR